MADVTLTHQEARDFVLSILEGISSGESGAETPQTWTMEMRDWCVLLLDRMLG